MRLITKISISLLLLFIVSCSSGEKKDNSDLYAKSQTRQAIIERSGTILGGNSSKADRDLRLLDAENRLRSGGGLFGKKGGLDLLRSEKGNQVTSMGMPINPYLWKASLETISFMPIASADPFAGIIITDWYSQANKVDGRCKLNIFIKGLELKTTNLRVNSFCQTLISNNWVSDDLDKNSSMQIENAILNKAKKIKLAQK